GTSPSGPRRSRRPGATGAGRSWRKPYPGRAGSPGHRWPSARTARRSQDRPAGEIRSERHRLVAIRGQAVPPALGLVIITVHGRDMTTRLRRFVGAALTAMIAPVVLAACGSVEPRSYETGPRDLVLQLIDIPGMLADPGQPASIMPTFSMYGDGRVIVS